MLIKKYKLLVTRDESKKTIKREGVARLMTTIAAILAVAGMIVMFVLKTGVLEFFFGVLMTLAVLAINSYFESRFNRIINELIDLEPSEDENSYIRSKCYRRYEKYTAYLAKATRIIRIVSAVFAAVVIALAIASLFGSNRDAIFYVAGGGVFLFSLVQMVYALSSFIMEHIFFGDCKAEFLLLNK